MSKARIDELTGEGVTPDPDVVEWIVTIGFLAYSRHQSQAAAKAWMKWNMTPEMRAMAIVESI